MTSNNCDAVFERLWQDYAVITPDADRIRQLLTKKDGEPPKNDHVAFRTWNIPPVDLESFARGIETLGYRRGEEYRFEAKKLRACHFETDEDYPKIFVSELLCEEFSPELQATAKRLAGGADEKLKDAPELLLATEAWPAVSYDEYRRLLDESEYAGWLSAFRIRANHFTVAVHELKTIGSLEELVALLEQNGFELNQSGGVIKGSPEEKLEQASTMAAEIDWKFADGVQSIPSCYYEFARRYRDEKGEYFPGFIAKSADKIFESTSGRK